MQREKRMQNKQNTVFQIFSLVLREAGKTGKRKREKERQTDRALIKHDCMIFQPQRGEYRKAHSRAVAEVQRRVKGSVISN